MTEFGKVLETAEKLVPHLEAPVGAECLRQPKPCGVKRARPKLKLASHRNALLRTLVCRLAAKRQRALEPQFSAGGVAIRERKLSKPQFTLSLRFLVLRLARNRKRLLEVLPRPAEIAVVIRNLTEMHQRNQFAAPVPISCRIRSASRSPSSAATASPVRSLTSDSVDKAAAVSKGVAKLRRKTRQRSSISRASP